jgi:tRNA threonylcarbamoyladenosine biosynthesis protein TsaE
MPEPFLSTFTSPGDEHTRKLGREFATRLNLGDLILLRGDLGAGKTTFVQGVAQGLGIESDVTSPTFVLILEHPGPIPLLHLDAYRLEDLDDAALMDAGIYDFFARTDAVKFIEWPERISPILPLPRFEILIRHGDESERTLQICEYIL